MVALTGGKTGGHIMPLIAISKKINNVIYVGAMNSLEEKLCKENNIDFLGLKLKKNNLFEIIKCLFKIKLKNISCIISTGGYVSFPLLLYGIIHRIPIYLLELNVIMGRTNRFFSLFAKKVFLTYELNKMKKKYEVVGLPIRDDYALNKYSNLDFDILIIGGSLGSKPLCELASILNKKYRVCLIGGKYSEVYSNLGNVIVFDYVSDILSLMLQAKLIISRAGASTTYEIFSLEKPCIIIPSMKTIYNHQYLNALYFEKKGVCKMLTEVDSKRDILKTVDNVISNEQVIINMKTAQRKLVIKDTVEKIISRIGEKSEI